MHAENSESASQNALNTLKMAIAEKLERAAGSIDEQTESMGLPEPYSRQASGWLHQSAAYVKDWDIDQANLRLRNRIQTHPGRSVLIGLAAGLLTGIWFQRR